MSAARLLVRALRDPADVLDLDAAGWTALLAAARAESLIGSLAHRLEGQPVPEQVARLLEDARRDHAYARTQALWEAEMARRALAPTGVPVILLKGTAYVAAGLAYRDWADPAGEFSLATPTAGLRLVAMRALVVSVGLAAQLLVVLALKA